MAAARIAEWRKLPVSLVELCIDTTLRCGQTFRWKKLNDLEWTCALHGRIISLKQDSTHLHYRVTWPENLSAPLTPPASIKSSTSLKQESEDDTELLLRQYFNLAPKISDLYEQWSIVDPNFKKRAPKFTGVRILRQDAWEALVGFICSSNNNIARISQMIHNLCLHYGPLIGHIDSQAFHDFPDPEALAGPGVESHLRELGFGYRAKYLAQTAQAVVQKPRGWLESLRNPESFDGGKLSKADMNGRPGYRKAHEELLALQGVGPKVADCVSLMGLGWGEAVPVDTHVWQIAQRDYKFGKGKHRSLTKITYDAVGDHFRNLWGKEAGWAQSVLFAANLRTFADRVAVESESKVQVVTVKEEVSNILLTPPTKRGRPTEAIESIPIVQKGEVLTESRLGRGKRRRV